VFFYSQSQFQREFLKVSEMVNKIWIGVCILVALATVSFGQGMRVTVSDTDGASVADAVVSVRSLSEALIATGKSSDQGSVLFGSVKTGTYIVSINADGFEYWSKQLVFDRDLSIELRPKDVAEIVSVTANFLAGSPSALEQTSGSIQTISKAQLEQARVFNFAEALRKVSGVSIRNEEGFGLRPNISIRGSDPTRSRKVLLLEDGVPLSYAPYGDNSSYYHPPIERFESVEVLKGSGQIAYGPVTVAGVVNYLTPNPPSETEYSLKLTSGNRDYFNGTAGFGTTIGNTGIALNFTRKQGEGSRDNIRAGVNDFSAKVIQQINPNNTLVLKYSHFDESSRVTYSGLTEAEFAADPRQNPFRNDDLEFFREGFSAAHTAVLGSSSTLTSTFYTSYFSRDWWRQSSNSSQRPNRLGSDPDCTGLQDLNTACGNVGSPRDFRTFGFEPRFNTVFDFGSIRNSLDVGFRAHYETQNRRRYNGNTPFSREEGSEITELNLRNALAYSVFAQNRFIFDKFSITPGVRVERVAYERSNLLNGQSGQTSLTQVIPGIGFAYNPTDTVTVFAGVHRGFAPPSTSDILTNSGGVIELDSELSWNYEVGVRSRPTRFMSIDAAYFRNDYENQIIPQSVAGGTGSTRTNAGATLQDGFEFNGRINSSSIFKTDYNFYFQTAYTYVRDAEFRSLRFSGVSGSTDVLVTGNRLPYVPKHLATSSVGFEYRGIHGFIENNFVGRQFTDDLNTTDPIPNGQRGLIGSQSYINATLNYRVESWKTTFFVTGKNVTDRLAIVDRTRGIYPSSPRLVQAGFKIIF